MYCVKCGKELLDNTVFCPYCGSSTNHSDTTVTVNNIKSDDNKDGLATASLVLGIIGFIIPCVNLITSIVGFILGIASRERSSRRNAGIILNCIIMVLNIIGFIILLMWPAIEESISSEWNTISTTFILLFI